MIDPRTAPPTPDRSRVSQPMVRDHIDALDRMRNFGIDLNEDRTRHHSAFAASVRSQSSRLFRYVNDLIRERHKMLPLNVQSAARLVRSFTERVRFVRFSLRNGSMVVPTSIASVAAATVSAVGSAARNGAACNAFPLAYGALFAGGIALYYGNKLWEELDPLTRDAIDNDDADEFDIDRVTDEELLAGERTDDVSTIIQRIINDALAHGEQHTHIIDPEDSTAIGNSSGRVPRTPLGGRSDDFRGSDDERHVRPPKRAPGASNQPRPDASESTDLGIRSDDARNALRDIREQRYGSKATDLDAAIRNAAKQTGESSADLYAYAYKESRFGRIIESKTSSATGTFQHLPQVFSVIKDRYGDDYPILSKGPSNTQAAAVAAALLIKENREGYRKRTGNVANTTDSYVLYLMGQGAGSKFLQTLRSNPNRKVVDDFPKQAAANRSVFFADKGKGKPLTYRQMYDLLDSQVGAVAVAVEANGIGTARTPSRASVIRPQPSQSSTIGITGNSPVAYSVGGSAPIRPIIDAQSSMAAATIRPASVGPSPMMLADASSLWEEMMNEESVAPDDDENDDEYIESEPNGATNSTAPTSMNYVRLPNGVVIQL